jgi:hypothetical protein
MDTQFDNSLTVQYCTVATIIIKDLPEQCGRKLTHSATSVEYR